MTLAFEATALLGAFHYEAAFTAADREILVLFGHSGAGKSLTLQFISGLMKPDQGRIVAGGETLFDAASRVNLSPQLRGIGYVVQELALFEHMTVAANVAFGVPKGRDKAAKVLDLLTLLDLDGFGDRRPRTLSGGQRQRVALARALGRDAPVLLLDEPFSALDDALRNAMRRELLRLRDELDLTILFVTHDLREAHFLADRIAVFDAGRVLQIGPREEVFRRPASRRVAELTGVANLWRGVVARTTERGPVVTIDGFDFEVAQAGGHFAPGQAVDVMVRAERINLRREMALPQRPNLLPAQITAEFAYGSTHSLHLAPEGAGPAMEVEIAARPYEVLGIATRRTFIVEIEPGDLHVVAADG